MHNLFLLQTLLCEQLPPIIRRVKVEGHIDFCIWVRVVEYDAVVEVIEEDVDYALLLRR